MRTALQVLGVGPSMHGDGRRPLERNVSTKERPPRSQPPSHSHQHQQSTTSPSSNNHSRSTSTRRPTVDISSPPPLQQQHHRREGSHGNANMTSSGRSHPTATNQTDFVPATPHSSQSGQSSSLGRTAGARMLRGPHPAFPFEPAVPTIPTIPDERTHHVNRTPSPSKTHRPQESSATKGRSVDLGLSLSWAPQRVREEAVLSYNQSAGGGSPATTSRVRTRWRGGGDVDEEGRLNGPGTRTPSSVAEEFREALGDAAYGTFKTYVHRFDAGAIPLQGPYGLIAAASRLLDTLVLLTSVTSGHCWTDSFVLCKKISNGDVMYPIPLCMLMIPLSTLSFPSYVLHHIIKYHSTTLATIF
ncbi:hypothetical protein BC629DRAFT_244173 [Irpex lacteus]|nr:hypothetical protein BC629DRAFT_244173 [Irpex lacteus]